MFLSALDTNTSDVSSLPEGDILIASSVRYLINHAEPSQSTAVLLGFAEKAVNQG